MHSPGWVLAASDVLDRLFGEHPLKSSRNPRVSRITADVGDGDWEMTFLESEKRNEREQRLFLAGKIWCRRGESNPHESHPWPDFESQREPGEKLRKANKTLGLRGFSPTAISDSLSQIEFPRWPKSGRMFLQKRPPS